MRAPVFSLMLAAGLMSLGSGEASAAAASGAALSEAAQAGPLTLVRDRCGRGRHFSKWRGICVWNGSEAPAYAPPYRGYYYYGPGPYYYGPPVYRPYRFYYGW